MYLAACAALAPTDSNAPGGTRTVDTAPLDTDSARDTGAAGGGDSAPSIDTDPASDTGPPGEVIVCEVGHDPCNGVDDDGDGTFDECCHRALTGDVALDGADATVTARLDGEESTFSHVAMGDALGGGVDQLLVALPRWVGSDAFCATSAAWILETPSFGAVDPVTSAAAHVVGEGGTRCIGPGPDIGGDADGDGIGDLVVNDWEFRTYVVRGPLVGEIDAAATDPAVYLPGDERYDGSRTTRWVGDLDGSGGDDLVVGQPGYSIVDDLGEFYNRGRLYVFSSLIEGTAGADDAAAVIYGEHDQGIGEQVAGLGDIDGDGYDDLGIDAGYVFLGPLTGAMDTSYAEIHVGPVGGEFRSAAGTGDIDGDGCDDAAFAGSWTDGARQTYFGFVIIGRFQSSVESASEVERRVELPMDDEGIGGTMGWSSGSGDFDGDGWRDVAVGGGGDVEDGFLRGRIR